ncbi:hypothetical protein H2200_006062 [Cladophialophora chaetospira]|uniref:Uncharacterized protein n=1 Tax=Cladophialophora chaetospira TaxID=386627 RepID=A0AA39CIS3_9EURO|nr:hypothetical protein H2200_006062 [Cladophialophora chaetospira]
MTPRDSARADQASQNFPTSRPHEPSNELPNDSEATPCDGSNNRTEKEDSAPPSRRLHPLGQVSQGQRSRSPRRREFDSEADNFRHRSRSHRRTDTGQHASRAPLQELRGGDRRQRRPRRHNRGNKTTLPASADENSEEATTSDALLPPSPPKAPTHEQTQTPGPKPSQQERLVTATQEKPKAVADGHQSQPTSTPVQNNDKLPPPVDLLRLDADIQQLIDEERAIAEKKLSGRTDGGQADEHHELPTVDDGVPKGHEISRKVGDVEIVSSHNSLLRRNGVQQPRTSNEAPDNGLPAQIQLDWCLRCHRTGHRVTTPCPNLMVERAVPNVRRNWSAYYRRNIAAPPSGPVTVIHVINISHRLSLQFNQFDVYVTDRDGFLQEVDRYLKSCLSIPCYVAWLACLSFCNATVETYLDGLVRTVNNLQYDTVLRALFQAITNKNRRPDYFQGRRLSDLPESECIRLMDGTRALHAIVRIDQLKYSMALDSLNSERTAYKAKHREALRRVEELVYRNRDALRSKKIRVALRSLSSVMLDPGRDEKLNRISPNDIPLPRILRLREDWSVIRDDEM